ncbi:hypothetical protein D3C81_977180 [compost metagenome]
MAALGAHQVHLLVRVVDALPRLQGHERDFAALVVGEVDECPLAAQALLPGQHPAAAEYAVDRQVAGVEARPLDRHQARQAEVDFIGDQLAARREVDGVADQAADSLAGHGLDHVTAGHLTGDEAGRELQRARHDGFHAGLGTRLDQLGDTACGTGDGHQHIHGGAQPLRDFIVHGQVTVGAAADDDVVRTTGNGGATGQLVALARGGDAVDEDVGRAFGNLHRPRVLVAGTDAFFDACGLAAVDEHVG